MSLCSYIFMQCGYSLQLDLNEVLLCLSMTLPSRFFGTFSLYFLLSFGPVQKRTVINNRDEIILRYLLLLLVPSLTRGIRSGLVNFLLPQQNNRNYCLPIATKWKTGKLLMTKIARYVFTILKAKQYLLRFLLKKRALHIFLVSFAILKKHTIPNCFSSPQMCLMESFRYEK